MCSMKKNDIIIFALFFLIICSFILTIYEINTFKSVVDSCADDFAVINKCGCVPCSWKQADELNKAPCFDYRNLYGK